MTPRILLQQVIRPTLALLGPKFQGPKAEAMLIAIALQESGLRHRVQVGGPAHGLWQFEAGGGVRGVLKHSSTRLIAESVCATFLYKPEDAYVAIINNDILACAFARLFLFIDPHPLPNPSDLDASWGCYLRIWRPGKPHIEPWADHINTAIETLRNNP